MNFDDILSGKVNNTENSNVSEEYEDLDILNKLEESIGFPFSDEQLKVLRKEGSPLSIISCAGAGKTTVLVSKILYLELKYNINPNRVLGITFNKEASESLKERYKKIRKGLGKSGVMSPSFNTFHSLFYKMLRSIKKYNRYTVVNMSNYTYQLLRKVKYSSSDDDNTKVLDDYMSLRGKLINEGHNELYLGLVNGEISDVGLDYLTEIDIENFALVMSTYESLKEERRELDFEDMISILYRVLYDSEESKERDNIIQVFREVYDYIFIDEYQDINYVQMKIIDKLLDERLTNNLTVIGDADQCQPPETLVKTPEGEKRIDELVDGDKVISWDKDKESVTLTGNTIQVAERDYNGLMYSITADGKTTQTTGNHKFIVRYNDTYEGEEDVKYFEEFAMNLRAGVHEIPKNSNETDVWVGIEDITVKEYEGKVYSLNVEDQHNYIADGLVTSNCIYEFRGSNPGYIVDFIMNYKNADRLYLGLNYRCKEDVLTPIISSITKNSKRVEYEMGAFSEGGDVVEVVGDDAFVDKVAKEADPEEDIILVRLNMQQKVMSDKLIENDVAVCINNKNSTIRRDVVYRDIVDVIKSIKYDDMEKALKISYKIFPWIKRNVWKELDEYGTGWIEDIVDSGKYSIESSIRKDVNKLRKFTKAKNLVMYAYKLLKPYYQKISLKGYVNMKEVELIVKHMLTTTYDLSLEDYLQRERRKESILQDNYEQGKGLRIGTMHSVKGLEYEKVFLYGINNDVIPNMNRVSSMNPQEAEAYIEGERRLFYVAWTRAKDKVIYNYESLEKKSMFLDELNLNNTNREDEAGQSN